MKKLFSLLAVLLIASFNVSNATETWVNNSLGAFITRLVIIPNGEFDNITDPLNQYAGTVEITFATGIVRMANLQHANHSFLTNTPTIDDSYQYIAVYHCNETKLFMRCDAIALKLENGQMCVGGFQFTKQLTNTVVSLYDLGCFKRSGELLTPLVTPDLGNIKMLSKEKILELIYGPLWPKWPIGPVCLSCPPWPDFRKELDDQIARDLKKRFEISIKQLK